MKDNPSTKYILAIVAIVFIATFTTLVITVTHEKQANANDAAGNAIATYNTQTPQPGMSKFIINPDGSQTPLR